MEDSIFLKVEHWMCVLVVQSCLTLWDPWTVARQTPLSMVFSRQEYWEWVSSSFSRGSSWPRDQTWVSHIAGRDFTIWATKEAILLSRQGYISKMMYFYIRRLGKILLYRYHFILTSLWKFELPPLKIWNNFCSHRCGRFHPPLNNCTSWSPNSLPVRFLFWLCLPKLFFGFNFLKWSQFIP